VARLSSRDETMGRACCLRAGMPAFAAEVGESLPLADVYAGVTFSPRRGGIEAGAGLDSA